MKRSYACVCGQALFFRNSQCIACKRALGYSTETEAVEPLEPGEVAGTFRFSSDGSGAARLWWRCANLETPAACNWLLPALVNEDTSKPRLCVACGLNRMVPDWSIESNARNWRVIELAKRRVVSSVLGLGLPVRSRFGDDPVRGLAFDFLSPDAGAPVMTGHQEGLITLNLEEADDVNREAERARLHEPYRTVLGHLRHEIGHYYWDVLIGIGGPNLDDFRRRFGDETQDYASALQRHYDQGADPGWPEHFISAYASAHPWEDWAETWAHYLHMIDAIDTAASLSFNLGDTVIEPLDDILPEEASGEPADPSDFDRLFDTWIKLVMGLNQMSRSMGERDFYPFVVSAEARSKLAFVHQIIAEHRASPTA